jgi:aspartate/methionine/tyrosine aminotransferase
VLAVKEHGCSTDDCGYPDIAGLYQLRHLIAIKHATTPDRVVITNGAKQAIGVLSNVLAKDGCKTVGAPEPYWPGFKTATHPLLWTSEIEADVHIFTWPNNPTGTSLGIVPVDDAAKFRIWDAVYNGLAYDEEHTDMFSNHDFIVGSMSKVYGMSSLRVGWIVFKHRVRDYIEPAKLEMENSTSGVSVVAQKEALRIIQNNGHSSNKLKENAITLRRWRQEWDRLLREFSITGGIYGDGGLFLFYINEADKISALKAILDQCCIDYVDTGFGPNYEGKAIRLNMGASEQVMNAAYNAFKFALNVHRCRV